VECGYCFSTYDGELGFVHYYPSGGGGTTGNYRCDNGGCHFGYQPGMCYEMHNDCPNELPAPALLVALRLGDDIAAVEVLAQAPGAARTDGRVGYELPTCDSRRLHVTLVEGIKKI
jgi:hypothetical protein